MSLHLPSDALQSDAATSATVSAAALPNVVPANDLYEAPAIESILSPDVLQREVLYAGGVISDPGVPIFPPL